MRNSTVLMAGLAGLAGFAISRFMGAMLLVRPAVASHRRVRVRQSGPEHMTNPPRHWEKVDEMSDESFPASDPPSSY